MATLTNKSVIMISCEQQAVKEKVQLSHGTLGYYLELISSRSTAKESPLIPYCYGYSIDSK